MGLLKYLSVGHPENSIFAIIALWRGVVFTPRAPEGLVAVLPYVFLVEHTIANITMNLAVLYTSLTADPST